MAKVIITQDYLEDIADAIRSKTGLSDTYKPSEMAPAIMTISGGGGIVPSGTTSITSNGTYNVSTYAVADVDVDNSYVASDQGKVVSNGALVNQSAATYTQNDTYDTTLVNSVTVDVESSDGSNYVYQDENGYIVLSDDHEGIQPQKTYITTGRGIDIDFTDTSLINKTTGVITDKLGTQFQGSFDQDYNLSGDLTIPTSILSSAVTDNTEFTVQLNVDVLTGDYNGNSRFFRWKNTSTDYFLTRQVVYRWTTSNGNTAVTVSIGDWDKILNPDKSLVLLEEKTQLVLVYNNGIVKLYRNKSLVHTYTCEDFVSFQALLSQKWIMIKPDGTNWRFLAFRLYNYALSENDIAKNYDYMKRDEPNTDAYKMACFFKKTYPFGNVVMNNIIRPIVSFSGYPITNFNSDSIIYASALSFDGNRLLETVKLSKCEDMYNSNFIFRRCKSLTSVFLPNLKKIYGSNMFEGTTSLKIIVLPVLGQFSQAGSAPMQSIIAGKCFYNSKIETIDIFTAWRIDKEAFLDADSFDTLIIRSLSPPYPNELHPSLSDVAAFTGTPFEEGGSGGTIYIPKLLYDELGTGSTLDFKAATNWSTVDSWGTITWKKIEGSYYETHYGDGTLIT